MQVFNTLKDMGFDFSKLKEWINYIN
jgi:hypothetical protein